MQLHRSTDYTAHPLEEEAVDGVFVVAGDQALVHDAWELLDYVEGQLLAMREVVRCASSSGWARVGLLGFMTGSWDLMWLMRELIGHNLPKRAKLTRGLAHKQDKSDMTADREFFGHLDAYQSLGVSDLILIDEVVSGSQVRTALARLAVWAAEAKGEKLTVHVLGLTEADQEERRELQKSILKGHEWADLHLIPVPALLAKDKAGGMIKPIRNVGTRYVPYRSWPGVHEVWCRNSLTSCSYRAACTAHSGSAYASTVRAICRTSTANEAVCWPGKRCPECDRRISRIHGLLKTLPTAGE